MSRLERVAYIDRVLREESRLRLRRVKERFGVSARQVKRDIEYMRDRLDAPIVYERASASYCYERPYNDLSFADEKALIFHALLRTLAADQDYIVRVCQ